MSPFGRAGRAHRSSLASRDLSSGEFKNSIRLYGMSQREPRWAVCSINSEALRPVSLPTVQREVRILEVDAYQYHWVRLRGGSQAVKRWLRKLRHAVKQCILQKVPFLCCANLQYRRR